MGGVRRGPVLGDRRDGTDTHEQAVADDDVVEHFDAEQIAGFDEALRQFEILWARLRITAGMIVRQDDRPGVRGERSGRSGAYRPARHSASRGARGASRSPHALPSGTACRRSRRPDWPIASRGLPPRRTSRRPRAQIDRLAGFIQLRPYSNTSSWSRRPTAFGRSPTALPSAPRSRSTRSTLPTGSFREVTLSIVFRQRRCDRVSRASSWWVTTRGDGRTDIVASMAPGGAGWGRRV
jgi:hypothetical protein